MKLSPPSSFIAAVILAESATAQIGRQRRPIDAKHLRPRSLAESAVEGFSMAHSMSLGSSAYMVDASGKGGNPFAKSGKSGAKSGKATAPMYDVEAEVAFQFEEGCVYRLAFSFKHDDNLPKPGSPSDCDPNSVPPALAPDGLPFLASREFYIPFSDEIFHETGFRSMGLDYQACGHPPPDVFTITHYDMHFYTKPIETRDEMTCAQPPNAPVCIPDLAAQTTPSGRAFFNVGTVWNGLWPDTDAATNQPVNMPANFTCDMSAAVPKQGVHCWDYGTEPASAMDWTEPVLVMGSYDSDITFFEPMVPLPFVTGDTSKFYQNDPLSYESQTITTLPYAYAVDYVAETGRTDVILIGQPNSC